MPSSWTIVVAYMPDAVSTVTYIPFLELSAGPRYAAGLPFDCALSMLSTIYDSRIVFRLCLVSI